MKHTAIMLFLVSAPAMVMSAGSFSVLTRDEAAKHIFEKLGVTKRVECTLVAQRRGFLKEIAI